MGSKELTPARIIAVKLDKGEEVIASLVSACVKHKIASGIITGIGALSEAEVIAGTSTEQLKPLLKKFTGPIEIASAVGNVSLKEGKPYVHLHAALGLSDHSCIAGHLVSGKISLVGEFFIQEAGESLLRKNDAKIGMWVLDI